MHACGLAGLQMLAQVGLDDATGLAEDCHLNSPQDGKQGEVRSWAAVGPDVLLLSVRGSRWCGNIGRHHRSNGIYYVVDLAAGCALLLQS